MRRSFMFAVLILAVTAPVALAGGQMFSLGLAQGSAYVYHPENAGRWIRPSATPELGVTGEYWYMFKEDYALALQLTYGLSSETRKPGESITDPNEQKDEEFTTASYRVRVGGDRVGKIGDRFTWFMGPGLEFWSGKSKWKNIIDIAPPGNDLETENVTVFGVNGRFGGIMELSNQIGVMGQIGHSLGYAKVTDKGAETTWWPNRFNAAWGVSFTFGAE